MALKRNTCANEELAVQEVKDYELHSPKSIGKFCFCEFTSLLQAAVLCVVTQRTNPPFWGGEERCLTTNDYWLGDRRSSARETGRHTRGLGTRPLHVSCSATRGSQWGGSFDGWRLIFFFSFDGWWLLVGAFDGWLSGHLVQERDLILTSV